MVAQSRSGFRGENFSKTNIALTRFPNRNVVNKERYVALMETLMEVVVLVKIAYEKKRVEITNSRSR